MNNKKVYIVLTRTNTLVAKTIRLITHDTYSHSSISFDKKCNHMFSFARKYRYCPFIGTFNIEDIRKGFFKGNNTKMAVYELDVTDEQYENIKLAIDEIKNKNKGYNILGLFLAYFKIKLHRNKYYCSEFIYEVLSDDKVGIYNKNNIIFKPEELINNSFNKIYEGKIKDYVSA